MWKTLILLAAVSTLEGISRRCEAQGVLSAVDQNTVVIVNHDSGREDVTAAGLYVGHSSKAYFITAFHAIKKYPRDTNSTEFAQLISVRFKGTTQEDSVPATIYSHVDETLDLAVIYIDFSLLPSAHPAMQTMTPAKGMFAEVIGHIGSGDWSLCGPLLIQNDQYQTVNGQMALATKNCVGDGLSGGPVAESTTGTLLGMHIKQVANYGIASRIDAILSTLVTWQIPHENLVPAKGVVIDPKFNPDAQGSEYLNERTAQCIAGKGGQCYYAYLTLTQGSDVKKNDSVALKYLRLGCDAEDGSSCFELGDIFENGMRGNPKDLKKSAQYFDRACQYGDSAGCGMRDHIQKELKN